MNAAPPRRKRSRVKPALLIFCAAFIVRAVYFLIVDVPPVQFDARQYVAASLAGPLALTNPSIFETVESVEAIDFHLIYDDLIDDEDVVWDPYPEPTFAQAFNEVFFAGPVYPSILGTVFRLSPSHDFWIIRILQALFDSLTAALLFVVMRRLVSDKGAWIASILYVFYGPAIYRTGELITETPTILLCVTILYLFVRAYDRQQYRWLILGGVGLALISCTKAATSALAAPLLLGWLLANRHRLRWAFLGGTLAAVTMVIVLAPWLWVVHWRFDTYALRDPNYGGANLRNANILETEGHNLDLAPDDFWTYPIWRDMRNKPLEYAGLFARKIYRQWFNASDDYRRGYPFGLTAVRWLHRIVILFACVGILLWPTRAGPIAWLPLAIIVYFVGLHTLMHAITRYNLIAMPVLMGAAAVGALHLLPGGRRGIVQPGIRVAGSLVAVVFGIWLFQPPTWMILPAIPSGLANLLFWASGACLIMAALWWGIRPLLEVPIRRRVTSVLSIAFVAIFWAQSLPAESNSEWSITLNDPTVRARREITFPSDLDLSGVVHAFVEMDIISAGGPDCNVRMEVDHIGVLKPVDSLIDVHLFYGKESYRPFREIYRLRASQIRSWVNYRIPVALLREMLADNQITITLSAEPERPGTGGIRLYGGLPVPDYGDWRGPGFFLTAVERLFEGKDPRVWVDLPLESQTSTSRLLDGEAVSETDLSKAFGRQAGQYRLLVRILMPDGRWLYF